MRPPAAANYPIQLYMYRLPFFSVPIKLPRIDQIRAAAQLFSFCKTTQLGSSFFKGLTSELLCAAARHDLAQSCLLQKDIPRPIEEMYRGTFQQLKLLGLFFYSCRSIQVS